MRRFGTRIETTITAAAAAALVSVSLSVRDAEACSCRPPPGPAQALASADAVFEGRAGDVAGGSQPGPKLPPASMTIPFTVLRAWKGVSPSGAVTVTTSGSSASCGYRFAAGETYLVYAYRDSSGGLGTGLCSRTRKAADAGEDFAALGAPAPQGDKSTPNTPGTSAPTSPGTTGVPPGNPSVPADTDGQDGNSTVTAPTSPGGAPDPSGTPEPARDPALGAAPPPSSGGCASCAIPSGGGGNRAPALAAILGLAAIARRITRRSR
jgi:hypothetical protein